MKGYTPKAFVVTIIGLLTSSALCLLAFYFGLNKFKKYNMPATKHTATSYHLPYTAKAIKDFWVFPFFGLGLTIITVGSNLHNPARLHWLLSEYWIGIVVLWLVIGFVTWAAASHRIVLTGDRIVFHEVLSKTEILYSQISHVEVAASSSSVAPRFINITKIGSTTPVLFSLVLCSRKDCVAILSIIAQHAPQARLGPNTRWLR